MRNKAIIINVTNDYKFISLIQKINVSKGLISSVKFHYNEQKY